MSGARTMAIALACLVEREQRRKGVVTIPREEWESMTMRSDASVEVRQASDGSAVEVLYSDGTPPGALS